MPVQKENNFHLPHFTLKKALIVIGVVVVLVLVCILFFSFVGKKQEPTGLSPTPVPSVTPTPVPFSELPKDTQTTILEANSIPSTSTTKISQPSWKLLLKNNSTSQKNTPTPSPTKK